MSNQNVQTWLAQERLLTGAVIAILLLLSIPLFTSERSPLNSDQSLYLAEALNISDGHVTYPTGDPIVHRAPLYPAFIAGVFHLTGTSLDSAYLVVQVSIVANLLLLFLLGRALFGLWGGAVASISAASSLYLRGIGTTLFLDSTQVTFLLASLLVYWRAEKSRSAPLMALAGGLLGASFLIKEASVLFLPLPLVIGLTSGLEPGWKRVLPAWFLGFAATTVWWWVWVYVQTDALFLVGSPTSQLVVASLAVMMAGVGSLAALLKLAPPRVQASTGSQIAAALVVVT
jgi:4-amino-4-deoxy-L-arabinose transferase-like glycosyltransferase